MKMAKSSITKYFGIIIVLRLIVLLINFFLEIDIRLGHSVPKTVKAAQSLMSVKPTFVGLMG